MKLVAQPINCSLKSDATKASSTDAMIALLAESFSSLDVKVADTIRIAAHNVMPGVSSDEGEGDAWPMIRERILAADILIFGTPIWMGQPSSVAGRMPSYSKVAVCAIVGNEDGAHCVASQVFQSLNDTGWTIPAVGACYWVGEAMHHVDFKDLESTPGKVAETARMVTANAAHLAGLLKEEPFPG